MGPALARERNRTERQRVPHYEVQAVAAPFEGIDERNGWADRGNPLNAFDPGERISLCSDQFARLLQWLLLGGNMWSRTRQAPIDPAKRCPKRDFERALKRPSMIGYRVVAMLLRVRPDLLQGMTARELARRLRISPRMLALYTISFGDNFPLGSKMVGRTSRLLKERIRRERHGK